MSKRGRPAIGEQYAIAIPDWLMDDMLAEAEERGCKWTEVARMRMGMFKGWPVIPAELPELVPGAMYSCRDRSGLESIFKVEEKP